MAPPDGLEPPTL